MDKEQQLYDKFVDVLIEVLNNEPTAKDLDVILKFLQSQNIQASTKHTGLNKLTSNISNLPFEDDDELPLRVVK